MGARVLRRTAQPKLLRQAGLGRGRANRRRSRRLTAVLALLGSLAVVVTPAASGVPGDPTPPVITPVLTGTLGNGGWYVTNVTVNWRVSDAESVILSSSGCDATTLTTDTPGTRLTCAASSDGGDATVSKTIRLDKTPPAVSAAPSRGPDANGWYNRPLTVGFSGSDAISGLASCSQPQSYAGPDSGSTSVAGSCVDAAGNQRTLAFALKYDATAPAVTGASAARAPDANGWYNHALVVSFAGADATSGVEACSAPTYGGPDSATASVSGSCRDRAGNTSTLGSFGFKYDATAPEVTPTPSRGADANGWYNRPLTVAFIGSDATSGIESCSTPTYDGPDAAIASLSGSCRDRAGNTSGSRSFALKYDATAPEVTEPVPARPPDRGGWYNRPVSFAFQGRDATSGIGSCGAGSYDGPDTATARMTASCADQAGNTGSATFPLQYDATGPTVSASPSRAPDANGWYNRPLTVAFAGTDTVSGVEACSAPQTYDGPDSAAAAVSGSCVDRAGNTGSSAAVIGFDRTPPTVTGASPGRPPDGNGWYNRPLVVSFAGSDVTSGVESCTAPGYSGPDNVTASVSGSCRDRAGNVSLVSSFLLKYDSTPPSLAAVRALPGNRRVALSWRASPDVRSVEIERSGRTIYRGGGRSFVERKLKNGVKYAYVLTAHDEAGNAVRKSVVARPAALLGPSAGARVSAPPLLAWTAVPNASYYNVQLIRGRKVLSAWPARPRLRLNRSWVYAGRRYRLTAGRYRWYVWPGLGPRAAGRYGRLLGGSSFVVTGP
jgi:hypothetical protein